MEKISRYNNAFKLLGLEKNASLEEIQVSFAYLYQMINLIYPAGRSIKVSEKRIEELKRLEGAYLLAINCVQEEIMATNLSEKSGDKDGISHLEGIEALLGWRGKLSNVEFVCNSQIMDGKFDEKDTHDGRTSISETPKPFFHIMGRNYHILNLSETELIIPTDSAFSCGQIIKGKLYLPELQPINIIGKIINKGKDEISIKTVTRIARKWIIKNNNSIGTY